MSSPIQITGEPSSQGDRCKYTVDRPLLPDASAYFGDAGTAQASPLARELLSIAGVESVLIADNVLTVTASYAVDWPALAIGNVIRKHLTSGSPIVGPEYFEDLPSEGDLKWAISDLLNREINPAVASHGGFVELIDIKKNNVFIRMGGGCQGCGAADVTLKQGVERLIREEVPQVREIMDATDHAGGSNPYYAPSK